MITSQGAAHLNDCGTVACSSSKTYTVPLAVLRCKEVFLSDHGDRRLSFLALMLEAPGRQRQLSTVLAGDNLGLAAPSQMPKRATSLLSSSKNLL